MTNKTEQSRAESRPPLRVCSFESRRADDMRSLIERNGGIATVAPSMQEVPLEQNSEVFAFCERLFAGTVDVVVFMTGVGARTLLETVETQYGRDRFLAALENCVIIARGPKPTSVLREWGVRIDRRAPEPSTWHELLTAIDGNDSTRPLDLAGKVVAVQEYGQSNDAFYRELQHRGAEILPVPVYRWALPDDVAPLQAAVRATVDGQFDVLLLTSANQLNNVLNVAESLGLKDAWLRAARNCVIASIGPTASETMESCGLSVDLEPSHPKMGHLVREALEAGPSLLAQKRTPS